MRVAFRIIPFNVGQHLLHPKDVSGGAICAAESRFGGAMRLALRRGLGDSRAADNF
ncbi:MAG: hypothetical protein IT335_04320 [Thermomicrobiales bacterium]|nr:hypothetical protein [Thermomicrobiales bacterium]